MEVIYLLLWVLAGASIGLGLYQAGVYFASRKDKEIVDLVYSEVQNELLNRVKIKELLNEIDWNRELSPLLDEYLEKIFLSFRAKNPMIGMFISLDTAKPYLRSGKEEILLQVPSIKEKLIDKLTSPNIHALVHKKIAQGIKKEKIENLLKSYRLYAVLSGAGVGLIFYLLFLLLERSGMHQ